NLLLGVILVSLLIWAVMGLRNAALTTVGIPFAFMVTMAIMYLTGNSINEMSLFSFVLVSGIIVDDAIIVVENIYRHVQMGKKLEDAVVSGTSEVFLPVVSATLTTIAAFLPMLIMSGSIGEFFAVIPMAVSYALAASLIECLLILPIHYLDYGPRKNQGVKRGRSYTISSGSHSFTVEDTPFMSLARKFFNRLLQLVLRFRLPSIGVLLLLFIAALFIALVSLTGKMNLIRVTFFPDDYSIYYVEVNGPMGTPIETTHKLIKDIAAEIMHDGPGMASSAAGMAGFYLNEDYMAVWGHHLGHVIVTLPALKKRNFEDNSDNDILAHLDTMRTKLAHFTDSGFSLRIRPEKDGPPSGKDVNIRVLGSQVNMVQDVSEQVISFLRNDSAMGSNLFDLQDDQGKPGRVLRFKILKERAAEYGLSPEQVATLAASVLNGRLTGKYRLLDEEIDIKVRINADQEQGLQEALMVPIIEHVDGPVRLADLCVPEFTVEPGFLNRFQGKRAITITGDIRQGSGISSQSVVDRVSVWFTTTQDTYPGVALNFAGEYESTQRSFTSLTYAFL
ncbi:MAG: efflux RND transporter permease subunit, partial [Anaerolineales bacterium]|nr:efflux RND transporter permease subunit [Anaerolineales bacterium]